MKIVLLTILLLPALSILADHGPKPEQEFKLIYQLEQPQPIEGAELLQCADAACSSAEPLTARPVSSISCSAAVCLARSPLDFAPYQQLILRFADRSRASAVFTHRRVSSIRNEYSVTVTADRLIVSEQLSAASFIRPFDTLLFALAVPITIGIELVAAVVYLLIRKLPLRRVLPVVVLGNIITLPAVWFGFPILYRYGQLDYAPMVAAAEIFAFTVEAGLLYLSNRHLLGGRGAVLLALLANAASFFIPICGMGF